MSEVIEKIEVQKFNEQQAEKLSKVFDLFYAQSVKIQATAKAIKMASIGENYVESMRMDDFEVEALMDSIMEINDVIRSECSELACNPNYLFQESAK